MIILSLYRCCLFFFFLSLLYFSHHSFFCVWVYAMHAFMRLYVALINSLMCLNWIMCYSTELHQAFIKRNKSTCTHTYIKNNNQIKSNEIKKYKHDWKFRLNSVEIQRRKDELWYKNWSWTVTKLRYSSKFYRHFHEIQDNSVLVHIISL